VGSVANREDVGPGNADFSGHCFSSYQDPHPIPPHHHLQPEEEQQGGLFETLFGISVLGDAIVGRVFTAFGSGVANPLVGMMLTCQMVVFAIHSLGDRLSLLGKDLLPSPFLLDVLLCFARIVRIAFVLLRCHLGNAKLVDLDFEG
jgi:hypothetical protein